MLNFMHVGAVREQIARSSGLLHGIYLFRAVILACSRIKCENLWIA